MDTQEEEEVHVNQLLQAPEMCNNKLCDAINSGGIEIIDNILKNGEDIHTCKGHFSPLYLALRLQKYDIVDHLLKRGAHVGAVSTTGAFVGLTIVHYSCLKELWHTKKWLFEHYPGYFTVEAADGIQPIQLAMLRNNWDYAYFMLHRFNVSIETEISYSHHKKYAIDTNEWNHNFGDKMTIFTYAMFNGYYKIYRGMVHGGGFLQFNPNLEIADNNNKTLLMYALENNEITLAGVMRDTYSLEYMKKSDNKGFTIFHYMVNTKLKFMEDYQQHKVDSSNSLFFESLDSLDMDIHQTVNKDPKTLPIHMAAYGEYPQTLKTMLLKYTFYTPFARPLFHATRDYRIDALDEDSNGQSYKSIDNPRKMEIIEIIVEDIFVKRLVKYPVHKEEIKLMEHLIKNHTAISEFVKILKKKYNKVFGKTKMKKLSFGSQTMSLFEALMASDKEYLKFPKDQEFEISYNFKFYGDEIYKFEKMINERLKVTRKRKELLEKWETVAYSMVTCLLLPYDCILYTVKCLTNQDLANCIQAFHCTT